MPGSRPVVLVILDGWGLAEEGPANAIAQARTPVFDRLLVDYLHTRLETSGPAVGLPEGQMGNSEVGHLTLGAGRVIDQDLRRIGKAIATGGFFDNPVLAELVAHVRERGSALQLMGLIGEGGVHAHARHLEALITLAARAGLPRVFVHAFTDGRDTPPQSGLGFMRDLEAFLRSAPCGRVATVSGRYWAMDRDRRWDRTARAWAAIAEGEGRRAASGLAAVEAAYAAGETDEFISPTVVADAEGRPLGALGEGDAVLLFNFRADRMRQLLAALTEPDFAGFALRRPAALRVATLTEYAAGQRAAVVSPSEAVPWPLARVLAEQGLSQFHTAETEKYAHVTYFFNGGREAPFPGEARSMAPSPQVATYDLAPEMSAEAVTDALVARIRSGEDDFLLVNYANADMVGHTGKIEAAVRAVETVDACLGRVLAALAELDGTALVTADHGNCEQMVDPASGGPHTAHTLNPVPLVIVGPAFRRDARPPLALEPGALGDVAPTILALLDLPRPASMTGRVLFHPAEGGPAAGAGQGGSVRAIGNTADVPL